MLMLIKLCHDSKDVIRDEAKYTSESSRMTDFTLWYTTTPLLREPESRKSLLLIFQGLKSHVFGEQIKEWHSQGSGNKNNKDI